MRDLAIAAIVLLAVAIGLTSICGLVAPTHKAGPDHECHASAQDGDTGHQVTLAGSGLPKADPQAEQEHGGALKDICGWLQQLNPDWVMAVFTVIIAFSTIAYVVAARGQLAVIQRQLEHQVTLERPLLVVTGNGQPTLHFYPDKADARRVYVFVPWSIKNIGRSPAWLYRQTILMVPATSPPPEIRPAFEETPEFADMPIAANDAHSGHPPAEWTPEQALSIVPGDHCIMVYGIVRYRDGSKRDHFTRFCFLWYPVQPNAVPPVWYYTPIGPRAYIEYT